MLVLTRRIGEEIFIADNIRVKVVMVNGQIVRLGITAPSTVPVFRQELLARCADGADGAASPPTGRVGKRQVKGRASSEPQT